MRPPFFLVTRLCLCFLFFTPLVSQAGDVGKTASDVVETLILQNTTVYTADTVRSLAETVAVSGGKIVYVGSNEGVPPHMKAGATVLDLTGKMVLPGFHDSHVHALMFGRYLTDACLVWGLKTREEILNRLQTYSGQQPDKAFIMAFGYALGAFPPEGPRKEDLDQIFPDRPAMVIAGDWHALWVNSKALQLAGITRETIDPEGGVIMRDPATGEPTGCLREFAAMHLVLFKFPAPTEEVFKRGMLAYLERAAKVGITSLFDAGVLDCKDQEIPFRALASLEHEKKLTTRVRASLVFNPEEKAQLDLMRQMRAKYKGEMFRMEVAKFFLDGTLEQRTALLLGPYSDQPENRGTRIWQPEKLERIIKALDSEGIQLHFHCIGDGATRQALDSLEKVLAANGRRDTRHTLVHLELVALEDIPRFRRFGAIANFQPAWFTAEDLDAAIMPAVGDHRANRRFLMKSFLDAGCIVVCGSDWAAGDGETIPSMNPLESIAMGMLRGEDGHVYLPEERVRLGDLLDAYTIRGAYVNFQEKETGSVEPGKLADLIVLDKNLFEIPAKDIAKVKVLLTLVGGREVFRDPALGGKPQ